MWPLPVLNAQLRPATLHPAAVSILRRREYPILMRHIRLFHSARSKSNHVP
jgi:hypothetical protein